MIALAPIGVIGLGTAMLYWMLERGDVERRAILRFFQTELLAHEVTRKVV